MAIPIFKLPIITIMTILTSMKIRDLNVISRTSNRVKGMVDDVLRPRQIGLLKAPLLIGCEILKSMSFVDLYLLANTSKLMKIIVQQEIKVRNHSLAIYFQPRGFILQFTHMGAEKTEDSSISVKPRIKTNPDDCDQNFGKISVRGQQSHIDTYWTSPFGGMKATFKDIMVIFRIPIRKMYIDLKVVGKGYKVVFNWINRISSEIPLVQVAGDNCTFETYSWVFDNLRPTKEVHFLAKPAEFSTKEAHRIQHEIILVKYGEWVKVEHLKSMECSSIYIEKSSITDEKINEFLHELVSGSNPNLKKLVIGMDRDPVTDILLNELETTRIEEYMWSIQLENGMECTVQYVCYEDDGQLGVEIEIGEKRFQMS